MFILVLSGATLLIRHGETDWNRSGRAQGQSNEPRLTSTGHEQAAQTAKWVTASAAERIHTLAVSTLSRAQETAKYFDTFAAKRRNWVRWDTELLWEVSVPWQGQQRGDIDDKYAEAYRTHRKEPENCPHFAELYARAQKFWEARDSASVSAASPANHWVVIAHQQSIRALLNTAIGQPRSYHRIWKISNAGCTLLDQQRRVHLVNGPARSAHVPDDRDLELYCESVQTLHVERGERGQLQLYGPVAALQEYLAKNVPGIQAQRFVWYPGGRSCFRISAGTQSQASGAVWYHNIGPVDVDWSLAQYLEECERMAAAQV